MKISIRKKKQFELEIVSDKRVGLSSFRRGLEKSIIKHLFLLRFFQSVGNWFWFNLSGMLSFIYTLRELWKTKYWGGCLTPAW